MVHTETGSDCMTACPPSLSLGTAMTMWSSFLEYIPHPDHSSSQPIISPQRTGYINICAIYVLNDYSCNNLSQFKSNLGILNS